MKKLLTTFFIFFVLGVLAFTALVNAMEIPQKVRGTGPTKFWNYQCIDTMKISRDKAKGWSNSTDLNEHIAWEMKTIKDLGANCVAIDTPYDKEFLPYLTAWVKGARTQGLHVWFRGNFSGWEEWFEYPKITNLDGFYSDVTHFITTNPQLFENGDIFTAAPEAENGGPLKGEGEPAYEAYRAFLIDEYNVEQKAFAQINKNVEINWQSMSGGYARRMYDQATIDKTGKTVTIDHYVSSPDNMDEYLKYFNTTYGAKINVGEYGAPIPDLNGDMDETAQAAFIDSIFQKFYENRSIINGVNYWDLIDGSTQLYNADQTPRKAAAIIKKYFMPATIEGTVTNDFDEPIPHITVSTADGKYQAQTDDNGYYSLLTVEESANLLARKGEDKTTEEVIGINPGDKILQNIAIKSSNLDIFDSVRLFFLNLKKRNAE